MLRTKNLERFITGHSFSKVMVIEETVHWLITDRCNISCSYCFKPILGSPEDEERLDKLANVMIENGVKKVVIGGGEPLLVKGLDSALRILKQGEVYVSLHTNGMGLSATRIKQLSELVDDIALPVDSMKEAIQKELRCERFLPVFNNLENLVDKIQAQDIGTGYHTVFTAVNHQDIPEIYGFIKQRPFDYWRIYEFNDDLAIAKFLRAKPRNKIEQQRVIEGIKKIKQLKGRGGPKKGYTDCLLAKFLLMEKQMKQYEDKRIRFVEIRDFSRPAYVFLDNSGNVSFYDWYSFRDRRIIGNILRDGFPAVKKKFQELEEKDWTFDDLGEKEFINSINNKPLWARVEEGAYFIEELEEIDKDYANIFNQLTELYNKRKKQLELEAKSC